MKIVNVKSGKPYQLNPETQIEVERTNPFFNEWGEQTVPIDLPNSDYNRELLHFPDLTQHVRKPDQNIETYIQDGEYFMPCRQAVLGSQRKGSISTSFYMNEGSFYSKIDKTSVQDVFSGETVEGVSTVQQAIDYCLNLYKTGGNDKLCVFPVAIKDDSGSIDNSNLPVNVVNAQSYKFLNLVDWDGSTFYNSVERFETVSGSKIYLSPGYYITPFIKANYVLQRIFSHFGYTLLPNFFTQTAPFSDMVFLNRVMDTLVNGVIKLEQLVPACTCADILNLFRKKFFCEFVPDEVAHTVSVTLFKDEVRRTAEIDLSNSVVGHPSIEYPDGYSQLIISPKGSISPYGSFDSSGEMKSQYPSVFYDEKYASFRRVGFRFEGAKEFLAGRVTASWMRLDDTVAGCDNRYYCGGVLKTTDIEVPETIPVMVQASTFYNRDNISLPYIGEYKALNSNLVVGVSTSSSDDDAESGETSTAEDNESESPMLCFSFNTMGRRGGVSGGTVSCYANVRYSENTAQPGGKWYQVSEYSLSYNGSNGIFEKFYRPYDSILRNSFHVVKAELLLSQHQKMTIPAFAKVLISGEELLPNNLKYNLGGKNEPVESEFYTMRLYEPVSVAPSFSEIFPEVDTTYRWNVGSELTDVSESDYNKSDYKDSRLVDIYPPTPTAKDVGVKQYEQITCVKVGKAYKLVKFWLEAVKSQA